MTADPSGDDSEPAAVDAVELPLDPGYRRSPYFAATLDHDCRQFGVYNHELLPSHYPWSDDPVEEYRHLVEHVVLWDVGAQRIIEISGPDAEAFADRLTCRDLRGGCDVGQCKYAPLIAADGGIVNDPVLLRLEADRFWLSLADSDAGLWARGIASQSPEEVTVSEPGVAPLQVQGPKAKAVVESLFGADVRSLDYYRCTETTLGDIPVAVSRTGWTGEVGYEVYLKAPDRGGELWTAIMDAGEPYDIRPIGPSEIRRTEAGIYSYGQDFDIDDTPFEVTGLEDLVEFTDGPSFVGEDALRAVQAAGVDRKLVGFETDERFEHALATYWPAARDGERVGRATTAVRSPRLGATIGYVWVPIDLADPGTDLRLEGPGGHSYDVTTASLPFYDPEKEIPRE